MKVKAIQMIEIPVTIFLNSNQSQVKGIYSTWFQCKPAVEKWKQLIQFVILVKNYHSIYFKFNLQVYWNIKAYNEWLELLFFFNQFIRFYQISSGRTCKGFKGARKSETCPLFPGRCFFFFFFAVDALESPLNFFLIFFLLITCLIDEKQRASPPPVWSWALCICGHTQNKKKVHACVTRFDSFQTAYYVGLFGSWGIWFQNKAKRELENVCEKKKTHTMM